MEKSSEQLLVNVKEALTEFNPPYSAQVRVAGASKDMKWLETLAEKPSYHSAADLGIILTALYSVYPRISDSPWNNFWETLQAEWHPTTMSFLGDAKIDPQMGFEPQSTLLDLAMGVLLENPSKRALADTPHILQAPWVPLIEEEISQAEMAAYKIALNPFRCHWGSPERLHTLVFQGGNIRGIETKHTDNSVELVFDLDTLPETEDKEKLRELVFYLDYDETHAIRFNGASATTFQISDPIEIESDPLKIGIQFEVLEGSGQWMGHLMRGNRPCQIAAKGANRFQSYDWQIILRTLRRTEHCKMGCKITMQSLNEIALDGA